ncbi:YqzE family protein [Metabacillus malikii]|uniref:YqzE family protein n=1 Tax=Metabacillus malikii TaxID=1504265 RepID=A0ABT9ZIY8_9BACI|nr:YqzE family protein [Metabacillus malikii]MDQ0231960.1 hypothetical protein [Metabacillus malikii]
MSTNDYVKYVTQQLIKFMDTPKETRKQQREEKLKNNELSTVYTNRWFGMLPFSLRLLVKNRKK